ncbi:hypothetical protein GALMADRAFT_153019 [Galerina marginata CBS 339.88]|uniref:G domain-containing protein n=1 Tax=Galerina marginata (strain CBS 339.88) TaxID=685588 RepID=A0A067TKW1_GALM3|nr:hypothetical protein GALMADRAFT_153019 [Galerina marginata CBS 339.88]
MYHQNHNVSRKIKEWEGIESDIVILVIGPIGAGKSTFINAALDNDKLEVGHGMSPCTTKPWPVVVDNIPNLDGHRLVLVDTPGFDSTDLSKDDERILKQIDTWLEKSYPRKVIFGGVLYVHDITNKKFKAADRRIIERFHRKYGDSAIQNTILATTNWGPPQPKNGETLEKELKSVHWVTTIEKGAKVHRFLRDSESAWAIINDLLRRIVEPQSASKGRKKVKVEGIDIRAFLHALRSRTTAPASCVVQ